MSELRHLEAGKNNGYPSRPEVMDKQQLARGVWRVVMADSEGVSVHTVPAQSQIPELPAPAMAQPDFYPETEPFDE